MTYLEEYKYDDNFQDLILASIVRHPKAFFRYSHIFDPAYFQGTERVLVARAFKQYRDEFGKFPNWNVFREVAYEALFTEDAMDSKAEVESFINKLEDMDTRQSLDYVVSKIVWFAKERAAYNTLQKAIKMMTDKGVPEGGFHRMFEEAAKVGNDMEDFGYIFPDDTDEVLRKVRDTTKGIRTGYKHLDDIWFNGWQPGWLVVPMAPPKRHKCLGINELVMMHDGSFKAVQSIQNGDLIMGDDSTPRKVLSCGDGYGPLYRVTQSNGNSYVCNDAHILCLKRPKNTVPIGKRYKNRYSTDEIIEMTVDDYYKKSKWFQRTWKGYKVGVRFNSKKTKVEPYYLGLWLGDGNSRNAGIHVGDTDQEVKDYLKNYAKQLGMKMSVYKQKGCSEFNFVNIPKKLEVCSIPECEKKKVTGDYCQSHYVTQHRKGYSAGPVSNKIVKYFKSLNILKNKHIPDIFKFNGEASRLQLLAGLLDSDGSLTKSKGFVFVNTCEKLAADVVWLARSLGFKAYLREEKTTCNDYSGKTFKVFIQGKISTIPTKLKRKKASDSTKATNRTTLSVEPIGEGTYYGFEIDGNGRFLLEDFTVTHNTNFCINLALNIAGPDIDKPVFYYACEIKDELAYVRSLCNIADMSMEQLYTAPELFDERVNEVIKKLYGNSTLVWKSFPSKTATIDNIRQHAKMTIEEMELREGVGAIFIDYAETVKPSDISSAGEADYRKSSQVYVEARALAEELNCVVVMPDRCNKETVDKPTPDMKGFQGSFEKAGIVDIAIGLCATDEELMQNIIRYFVFLNRHGNPGGHFRGKVIPEKMILTVDEKMEPDQLNQEREDQAPQRRNPVRRRGRHGNGPVPDNLVEDLDNGNA